MMGQVTKHTIDPSGRLRDLTVDSRHTHAVWTRYRDGDELRWMVMAYACTEQAACRTATATRLKSGNRAITELRDGLTAEAAR